MQRQMASSKSGEIYRNIHLAQQEGEINAIKTEHLIEFH